MKKLCFLALLSLVVAAGCSKDDTKSDTPNNCITGDFDPLFAQELQKRDYVANVKHITPAEVKDITRLDVLGTYDVRGELTSLRGIEYFESLTSLWCHYNQLTSLDISRNKSLDTLACAYNQLTSLDISNNRKLIGLSCDSNQLTSLDVSKNPALTVLWCYSNQLTSLDVSKNPALTVLWCDSNQLTSLDVSNNPKLYWLQCGNNPGDGTVFPVTAWFDNNSVPSNFTRGIWYYDGKTVRIDYRKAE